MTEREHRVPTPEDPTPLEQAWEADIAALLGGLQPVEPPAGAIAAAMDRRPRFAYRSLVVAGVTMAVVGVGLGLAGAFVATVRPPVAEMAQTHGTTEANLFRAFLPGAETSGERPPAGKESLWAVDGHRVSVFRDLGEVDFESLPASGSTTVGDHPAWSDGQDVVVVQVGDSAVTIIGADVDMAARLISELDIASPGLMERGLERLEDMTSSLGFADLD